MIEQRELILLDYPFSDLEATKVRPAVVVSNNAYNRKFQDMIIVPLTTNLSLREHSISLVQENLEEGWLIKESRIKVDRIMSVEQSLIRKVIGKVQNGVLTDITTALSNILKPD